MSRHGTTISAISGSCPPPRLRKALSARVLSAPNSPLRTLLQVVAKETQLLRADAGKPQLAARWRQRMDDARHSLEAVFGRAPADGAPSGPNAPPESIVDAHFLPLRQLVGEQGSGAQSGAPLDAVMQTVNALYEYLNSASAALATDVFSKLQADASQLPVPLRSFLNELANGAVTSVGASARKALAVQTRNGIGSVCRQMTFARYPFDRDAARDMPPDEFTRLFAAGGLFDDYFQKNFAAETDTSGPRWRFRPLPVVNADDASFRANAPRDAAVLDTFSAAAKIRDTYLGANGRTPAFDIVVTPLETDPEILQYTLTIGVQTLRYAHGPATTQVIKWTADATQPVTLKVNTVNGQQTLLRGEGPWVLQRLFDKAQIAQGLTADGPDRDLRCGRPQAGAAHRRGRGRRGCTSSRRAACVSLPNLTPRRTSGGFFCDFHDCTTQHRHQSFRHDARRRASGQSVNPFGADFDSNGGTIGSAAGNVLVLTDDSGTVAMHHADLHCATGNWRMRNISERSTLTVNGRPLSPGTDVSVVTGDFIGIGVYVLRITSALSASEAQSGAAAVLADNPPFRAVRDAGFRDKARPTRLPTHLLRAGFQIDRRSSGSKSVSAN
ncbi:IcmF-like protein [Candidatus Burkholderia humilis]|nr:IcmF-like protein [Candidatus Burkholderia humilis]